MRTAVRHPRATAYVVLALASASLAACTLSPAVRHAGQISGATSSLAPAGKSVLPQITRPIPPPTAGNIKQTVAPAPARTLSPVSLAMTAKFGTGVTATIVNPRQFRAKARWPGEISGPAIEVGVQIRNGSSRPVDVGNVVINSQDVAGTPLVSFRSRPSAPISGTLAPGAHASGVYVFELPQRYREPFTISVRYSSTAPVAVFTGGIK